MIRKIFYSNFVEKIDNGRQTALYHKVTGKYILFNKINPLQILEHELDVSDIVDKRYVEILNRLIDYNFIFYKNYTAQEESKLYKNYRVVINKTVFYSIKDKKVIITVPKPSGFMEIELNEKESKKWEVVCHHIMDEYKNVENEVKYFMDTYGYKASLVYLIKSREEYEKLKLCGNISLDSFDTTNNNVISSKNGVIDTIYLKLTDRCNLKCSMCGQANNIRANRIITNNNLKLEDVIKFLDPIIEDIKYVYLWGGEPFLNNEILDYIKYFKEQHKFISIATNGTLLSKYIKQIVDYGVDEVVISIDGPDHIHDKIRGVQGTFRKICQGIKEINSYKEISQRKPNIVANCTVTEINEKNLRETYNIVSKMNVNKMFFQLPIFVTKRQGQEYEKLCKVKWNCIPISWKGFDVRYKLDIDKLYCLYCDSQNGKLKSCDFYNVQFNSKEDLNEYFCYTSDYLSKGYCNTVEKAIVIEADGKLVNCPDFPDIQYGDINNSTFDEFVNNSKRSQFIECFKNNKIPICSRCCQLIHM